jgi:hypothetical protein
VPKKKPVPGEKDIVSEANRPLEVSFIGDGPEAIVIVRNLCRVVGRPACVAHVLKKPFEDDRAAKRPRAEHRYIPTGVIASELVTGKDAIAQNIKRCRTTIAEAFEAVHGRAPGKDLLIEVAKGKGYRLDPDLLIVMPDA